MAKCKVCELELEDGLKYSNKTYHKDCLFEYLTTRTRQRMTEEEATKKIDELVAKVETKKRETKAKNDFYDLLLERYGVRTFPKRFYIKIAEIVNGKHKKFRGSVSYIELLAIYRKMSNYLINACAKRDIKRDKAFDYELSIVLGSVDRYRAWVDKERAKAVTEVEEEVVVIRKKVNKKLKKREVLF